MYDTRFKNGKYKARPFVQRTCKNTYQAVVTVCLAASHAEDCRRYIGTEEHDRYDDALRDARSYAEQILIGENANCEDE